MSEIQSTEVKPAEQPASVSKPSLTPQQRLAERLRRAGEALQKAQAAYDAVLNEYKVLDRLNNLAEGDKVLVRIPKGPAEGVWAVITGRRDGDDVRFKVYFGEGFDAQVAVVAPSQILQILGE